MSTLVSSPTTPSTRDLPKQLFGYEVIETIGEGAGSTIYAVSDPASKQLYALKHVVRKTDKHARFIEQLEAEFNVAQRVNHPNLRKVIDYKFNRSLLRKITNAALVMELFDGQPLETNLPRELPRLVGVFIETAKALEAMHKAGYVHCDLKPNNILIGPAAALKVKVIDLGQACSIGTAKKRIQGTPDYISPEQVRCQAVTHRTDIFNFGATMYWALSGRKLPTLFTVKKDENSFLSDGLMQSPRQLNPLVPEALSNFVMECVRTNPAKRPDDMTEVLNRLEIIAHAVARTAGAPATSPARRPVTA
jgi:serine/threonine-protein kinase